MKKFNETTDKEAISLATKLNSLTTIGEKIGFIFSKTGWDGIGIRREREIAGKTYQWGVRPKDEEEKEYFLNWFISHYKNKILSEKLDSLNGRLDKCLTITDKEQLLKAELDLIDKTKGQKTDIEIGFNEERLRQTPSPIYTYNHFHFPAHKERATGAALYLFSNELKTLLDTLNEQQEEFTVVEHNGILYPEKAAHKVLLLDKLGVLEHLRSKYPNESVLAKVIAVLLGIRNPEITTIRKGISRLRDIENPTSAQKVETILSQFSEKPQGRKKK
jgi:hypothetical protein